MVPVSVTLARWEISNVDVDEALPDPHSRFRLQDHRTAVNGTTARLVFPRCGVDDSIL